MLAWRWLNCARQWKTIHPPQPLPPPKKRKKTPQFHTGRMEQILNPRPRLPCGQHPVRWCAPSRCRDLPPMRGEWPPVTPGLPGQIGGASKVTLGEQSQCRQFQMVAVKDHVGDFIIWKKNYDQVAGCCWTWFQLVFAGIQEDTLFVQRWEADVHVARSCMQEHNLALLRYCQCVNSHRFDCRARRAFKSKVGPPFPGHHRFSLSCIATTHRWYHGDIIDIIHPL